MARGALWMVFGKVVEAGSLSKAAALLGMPKSTVSRKLTKLEADLGSFTGADQDFLDNFFIPGIQRAGGLKAARAVLANAR